MYTFYHAPTTLAAALALKAQHGDAARVLAGGTDLLIELLRGGRRLADGRAPGVIDLTRVPGLAEIVTKDGWLQLGALVTHNQCVANPLLVEQAFPLVRACWEVGAPQIRNRATLAGNIITASPANDTLVPLLALNATVTVQSAVRGERTLPLGDFLLGFRKVDLAPDEILVRISLPALTANQPGTFIKLGLRRAQAISVITVAVILDMADGLLADASIRSARIALGAVAATVVRATAAEEFLRGENLSEEVICRGGQVGLASRQPD